MRLTPYDELPFHQAPTPFSIPATSDVHFNDGYFMATYAPGWYVVCGLRLHPNMNVLDAFMGVARDGHQEMVRASRALRPDAGTLAVGPLRIEVLEPLRRVRVVCEGAPVDLAFDLTWEALGEPAVEAPYEHRKNGHLINHLLRYTQVCRTQGRIRHRGEDVEVDGWHAMRDHSWGIRSSMGPRTPHGGERDPSEVDHRRFRLWVPFATDTHVGFFHTHEGRFGDVLDFEGHLEDRADGTRTELVGVRHALAYHPGTRQVSGGSFVLRDEHGVERTYELEPAGTPADVQGVGYYGGWHDSQPPGCWRGVGPHVEHDRYEVGPHVPFSAPPHVPAEKRLGPTEFPSVIRCSDGSTGMAHFEHHVLGRYEPYDLT